jgi:hypothetical protein
MLPAKFGSIWPNSFRGEDFFNIIQSETRIALGGHIFTDNTTNKQNNIPMQCMYVFYSIVLAHLTQRVM